MGRCRKEGRGKRWESDRKGEKIGGYGGRKREMG